MNRTELVRAVAERAGSDEAAARRHVDAVFDTVMDRVSAGERVIVTGFGTFDRLSRPARSARNPRTGLPVEVPAAQVPRFRSGQTFRTRVAASAPAAEVQAAAEPAPVVSVAVEPSRPKKAKNGGKKAKKGPDAKKKNAKQAKAASAPAKKQGKAKARAKAGKPGKPGKAAKAGR
ncbi:HU family DNA-binding protein [Actinomadura madurae]|uniref:HU family DNA-binding protein n=1 Tax=Actinomadura madurae TaxID=1993 RepID=UPI0020D25A24|nr:HU family DNA-binding protein [Actinomadura madurae]MCP9955221.1 HU family DNA-binding protein [Actinomadura madurae]MCP9971957.1 HU family DNA-binding protein [Actinomadura madurae]MCP9984457.1 HU family DNA-binding protein [Actinomadura madurae]MCQ0003985.1 HU family DNA-binding protein [Actinomadura madurae]MCQ0020652.1 HU family DNA-binding protein [Actinomadura madurae]